MQGILRQCRELQGSARNHKAVQGVTRQCYSVLGECSLVLQRARQVQSCVMACMASAMLHYGVLGECSLVLRRAW